MGQVAVVARLPVGAVAGIEEQARAAADVRMAHAAWLLAGPQAQLLHGGAGFTQGRCIRSQLQQRHRSRVKAEDVLRLDEQGLLARHGALRGDFVEEAILLDDLLRPHGRWLRLAAAARCELVLLLGLVELQEGVAHLGHVSGQRHKGRADFGGHCERHGNHRRNWLGCCVKAELFEPESFRPAFSADCKVLGSCWA